MKQLTIALATAVTLFFAMPAQAQVHVSINIGDQPTWGPSGYDYVEYYYIPDMDAYYDVRSRVYIYNNGGRWVRTTYVPARYRNVDLYRVHKVVINERDPWLRHDRYRTEYRVYRGRHDQVAIRDRHDNGNHYGHNKSPMRGHNDNGNHGDRGNNGGGHGHGGGHGRH